MITFGAPTGPSEGLVRFGHFKSKDDCQFAHKFLVTPMFEKSKHIESVKMTCAEFKPEADI